MLKSTKIVSIFSFVVLLICSANCQLIELLISPTVTGVQQLSNYTFTINLYAIMTVSNGAIVVVTFPDDY